MLEPNFTLCQDTCSTLKFTDLTGFYDAVDNPGGYGGINPSDGDITSGILTITDSAGAITTVDITSPLQEGDTTICITQANLGLSGTLADGIYIVNWELITDDGSVQTFNVCLEFFFYCNAKTGVDNLIANLSPLDCGCNCDKGESPADRALLAFTLLKALESAACCYKIEKFTKLLEAINTLTDDSSCKTC